MRKSILVLCCTLLGPGGELARSNPDGFARERELEAAVASEIERGRIPGAVVLVGQGDAILCHRAFGHAALVPERRPMTRGTLFDLASLTKPVATAAAVLILADRGRIRLADRVEDYLPDYACGGKERTQIRHLLNHTSGLPAYTSAAALRERWGAVCPDPVVAGICALDAVTVPGEACRYSCLGYILAARIVEIVSGRSLADFSQAALYRPLGMNRSAFTPSGPMLKDVAGSELPAIAGQVHDPLARLMGGVSGNAGLFSTAGDLSRFCRMLLRDGLWEGRRVLSPEAVRLLTTEQGFGRACGFDVNSSYAWIKGAYAGASAFCHAGYTGTSIVCDPVRKRYVIILTNRVHPDDSGTCRALRKTIADIVFQPDGAP
jgi:CubicO group peptidase (beta-lactamase class C family)